MARAQWNPVANKGVSRDERRPAPTPPRGTIRRDDGLRARRLAAGLLMFIGVAWMTAASSRATGAATPDLAAPSFAALPPAEPNAATLPAAFEADQAANPADPALPPEESWSETGILAIEPPTSAAKPAPSSIRKPAGTIGGPVAGAARQPAGALSGILVFTTPGHGFLHRDTAPYWYTQRGLNNGIVEDFSNYDQFNFFVHYLFNAGATVIPVRPIGYQPNQVLLDNDEAAVTYTGTWTNSTSTAFYGTAGDVPYRWATVSSSETAVARYTPNIPAAGYYPVYTWVRNGSDRIRTLYRVVHTGGTSELRVDHQRVGLGWVYLGTYYFNAGTTGYCEISNQSPDQTGVIIADSICFGNGMGNYDAGYGTSGYERELEGARYWVRFARGVGTTDLFSTYSDVSIRPRYSAYMNDSAYGSFYDRIYMSFHSNAGSGTARGAMGLGALDDYPTDQQNFAAVWNSEIEADMEALDQGVAFGQDWADNSADWYDGITYGEISNTALQGEMTGTIMEVAFHDNADDTNLMKDPRVRNTMGRASYQALVKFLNQYGDNSIPLNLLPDPPTHVRAVNDGSGGVTVSWVAPVVDTAGGHAATGYVVYRSADGYGFGNPVIVSGGSTLSTTIAGLAADQTWYFRVAATNAGGESMPTETVGVRVKSSGAAPVLVVNGYDRSDRYIMPTRFIAQNLNVTSTFVRPDKANSFNFVLQHGEAIAAAGRHFDSCSNEAIEAGLVSLGSYPCVVWIGGQQASVSPEVFPAFSAPLQTAIQTYLNASGRLFVSGSELAWDLDRDTNQSDTNSAFLQSILRTDYVDDDVYTNDTPANTANGAAGSIFAALTNLTFDNGSNGTYDVAFPDVVNAHSGSTVAMTYAGSTEAYVNAAIQYDGAAYKLVYLAFPFETLYPASNRNSVMTAALDFLIPSGVPTQTAGPSPTPSISPTVSLTPTVSPTSAIGTQYLIENFEGASVGAEVMFRDPGYSGSTTGIDLVTDVSEVSAAATNTYLDPAVASVGAQSHRFFWTWNAAGTGFARATSYNVAVRGNPIIDFTQGISIYVKVTQGTVDFGLWVRETGVSGTIGANGGATGTVEKTANLRRLTASPNWQYLYFVPQSETWATVNGNSVLDGQWGTLESFTFTAVAGDPSTTIEIFVDDIYQGPQHNPGATPTATPTASPTASPTTTATASASPTASVTPTPSLTPSPTPSPTASLTPSPSPTASLSPTPSVSPTPLNQDLVDNFEPYTTGTKQMFLEPAWSGTTAGVNTATDVSEITAAQTNDILDPAIASPGLQSCRLYWQWTTPGTGFVRATTYNAPGRPNPIIDLTRGLSVYVKITQGVVDMGLYIREAGVSGTIGDNGGVTGTIEELTSLQRVAAADQWQYVHFDLPNETWQAVTGNGALTGQWGTLEALTFKAVAGSPDATVEIFVDDIYVGDPHNHQGLPTPTGTPSPTPSPTPDPGVEWRGFWADAWHEGFKTAAQVTTMVNTAKNYNYNAVVVQIRKRGDCYYFPTAPNTEPRATDIGSSFDPLQEVINQAHAQNLKVHAWITTMLIEDSTISSDPNHIMNAHPEFLMKNSTGATYIGEGYYIDPGNPQALQWNHNVVMDLVTHYDIDAIHFDYVRYPAEDSGYNDVAIARYNAEYGLTGQPLPTDAQFKTWRRRQITDWLRATYADIIAVKPNMRVEAAVFGSRSDAYANRFQDWSAWMSEKLLDSLLPMNYASSNSTYNTRADDANLHKGERFCYMGQGAYLNTKENTATQLLYARSIGCEGVNTYSYQVTNSNSETNAVFYNYILANVFATPAVPPPMPWKTAPTGGYLRGRVTDASTGDIVYNATITIAELGLSKKSDSLGKYAFIYIPPGTYTVTVSATGYATAQRANVVVTAGAVTTEDFALGTGPQVASIVRVGSNPTNAASATFRATFSGAVSGVDAGNFSLSPTLAGASISGATPVSGSAPDTAWNIAVATGSGDGPLGISLASATGIQDALANPLDAGNLPFAGPQFTVDKTAPAPQHPAAVDRVIASGSATLVTFSVSATDTADPAPQCVANPPSGSAFPLGRTTVSVTATDWAGNQTVSQFNVTVDDSDGVPFDEENSVPSLAGSTIQPTGDGNGDNIPDVQQHNAVSVRNAKPGQDYITVVASAGSLADVYSTDNPTTKPGALDPDQFPQGFVGYRVTGLTPGASVTVDLFYETALTSGTAYSYYKYGRVNGISTPRLYRFQKSTLGIVGAEILTANQIRLTFIDGMLGDGDLAADGSILDPGGSGPLTDPLLVDLASFTATADPDTRIVQLRWETGAEFDNAGFNVYRAVESVPGAYLPGEQLNIDMIPAEGDEVQGAVYTFDDPTPLSIGETRGYILEDVDMGSMKSQHGPAFASLDEPTTPTTTPTATPSSTPTGTPTAPPTLTPTPEPTAIATVTPSPTLTASPTPPDTPVIDSDGDRFPDWYEDAEGTNPDDSADYPPLGDVNNDGVANAVDATLIYTACVQGPALTSEQRLRADVNLDGRVDIVDSLILYRWSLRLAGYPLLPHIVAP